MNMERDNELFRSLLIQFRDEFEPESNVRPHNKKEDYHMYLLQESGLIEAEKQNYMDGEAPTYFSLKITSAGHDFIEAAENDTVWENSKEALRKKGMSIGTIPIDVLKEYLKMQFKKHIGLE